jgi:hypothetical protein
MFPQVTKQGAFSSTDYMVILYKEVRNLGSATDDEAENLPGSPVHGLYRVTGYPQVTKQRTFQVHRYMGSTGFQGIHRRRSREASRFTGTWVIQGYRVSTGDEAEPPRLIGL